MMNIEEMKTRNGYFDKDGKTYVLLQQAYLSTWYNEPVYEATAIAETDQADEDGWKPAYQVYWEITDNDEDESNNADWDNPIDVTEVCEYNVNDGRIA